MPDSCPDIVELEQYVLHELDEQTRSSIATHLAVCDACCGEIGELEENLQLAASLRKVNGGEPAPQSIGPYRVLRKLGQGGMGTVYEAEQENPRRSIALKMIRPGLVSPALLSRFRHEAQVLGMLRHSGIAQIYQAGTHQTQHGPTPYFVMELVHGPPLLEYADAKKLDLPQRLELLAKICDAVQHAHQRGVIHRDLKPDNILVDESGDAPQPKILDFGVARVVDPEAQTTTLHTSAGQIIGTVAYMSPEQARGEPSEIDTRSDVYALGVIGYQLLCGRLPYKLSPANVAASVRTIVQDDPAPLSSVDRTLRGDVTTIVSKALEKTKSRRYPSAAEMAADVRRFLNDEPVTAHPPSTIYQLGKFAQRNKGLVAGIVAAFILLVAGVIGTSIGLVRAQRARVAADSSAAESRREAGKQKAVTDFVRAMLASASPSNRLATDQAKGPNVTLLEVMNEASRKVDAGSLAREPEIEIAVRDIIAATYQELGDYDNAGKHMSASLELSRRAMGNESIAVANNLNSLAVNLQHQGRLNEAEKLSREALAMFQRIGGEESEGAATVMNNLSSVVRHAGNLKEAEALQRRVLKIREDRNGRESREVAIAMNNLAGLLKDLGKAQEAEALCREVLRIDRKILGEEHPDIVAAMQNLAQALKEQGRIAEAETLFREAMVMHRKLFGEDHVNSAILMNNLAQLLQSQKRLDEAEPLYRRAIEIQRKHFGDGSPILANYLNNLGTFYYAQDRIDDAAAIFRETLDMRRKLLGEDHILVAASLHNLAYVLDAQKKSADAEQLFRRALEIKLARIGPDHPDTAATQMQLGNCLLLQGRYEESERELLAAFRVYQPMRASGNRNTAPDIAYLVNLYNAWGKPDQAKQYAAMLPMTKPGAASAATKP